MTKREREKLRQAFLPSRVQLLFVGESPPTSGRFFYSGNSGLYRAMCAAFQSADVNLRVENFLTTFRSCGCYFTDLSHEPIDHLAPSLRRTKRSLGEKSLAGEIARFQPVIIAPLLRAITGHVENAVAEAGWHGQMLCLPYPGRWIHYRKAFILAVVPVIKSLRVEESG